MAQPVRRSFALASLAVVIAAAGSYIVHAAISLSTSTAYTQNFDGMGVPATSTTASTVPLDFRVDNTSTSTAADVRKVGSFAAAVATTARAGGASLSTSAANGTYNFGAGTASLGNGDRAIGFLASGTATASGNLYAQLVNNGASALAGLRISYNVEKYRNGSNANGFRIQMYYSPDGVTWTSAGDTFKTAFAPDANNNGFATAPGASVAVTDQVLSVSIPAGTTFYLAWNYSVTAGTTVTNAQALAVDDISIVGVESADPAAVGSASPNPVQAGSLTQLSATVTPGSSPASTGLAVSCDLTAIGGSSTFALRTRAARSFRPATLSRRTRRRRSTRCPVR